VRLLGEVATYSETVMQPAHMENVTNLAARYALARRGVTHVALPIDVQVAPLASGKYDNENQPHHTSGDWRVARVVPASDDLARAADVLNAGRKVVIMVGAGTRGAGAEVEQLAELLGAPVGKALLGKDVLPDDSPYTTMGVAIIGTAPSQEALERCDTLLLVGTSMPYTSYYPKVGQARGVQIDKDPARIGLRYPVEVGLTGDAGETLRALLPLLRRNPDRSFLEGAQQGMAQWRALLAEQKAATPCRCAPRHSRPPSAATWPRTPLSAATWARPRTGCPVTCKSAAGSRFTSGTLASMACGLP